MVASRKIDPALVVRSPMTGKITARNAPAGAFGAAGKRAGALFGRRRVNQMDAGECQRKRQPVISLGPAGSKQGDGLSGRVFKGKISKIYATVDPNTHRVMVRSEIADPKNELRPGMLANFVIRVQDPVEVHRHTGERRGPRRRWHDDGVGDHRPPPFCAKNHQDRPARRRPRSDPRRLAARRTGRHRRGRISSATCCRRRRPTKY